jgi:hypothetical protein
MPCLIVLLALAFPRILLLLLFFFTNYLSAAYHSALVPLLGFLFLPVTTLAYAWLINAHMPMEGFNLGLLILAVIIDVGSWGGGAWGRGSR